MGTRSFIIFSSFLSIYLTMCPTQTTSKAIYDDPGNCSYWLCSWELKEWNYGRICEDEYNSSKCDSVVSISDYKFGTLQSRLFRPNFEEAHCLEVTYFMSQFPDLYLSMWISFPDEGDREIWNITKGDGTLKLQQFSIRISTDFNLQITIKGTKNGMTHGYIYIYQIMYKGSPCNNSDGSVIVVHWESSTSQTTEMKSLTGQDYNIPYILSDDKRGKSFKSNMAVIIAIPVAVAVTTAAVVIVIVVLRHVHNRRIQGDKTQGTNMSLHAKYVVSGQDIMPGDDDSTTLSLAAAGNTVVDTYNRIEFKNTTSKSDITCQEYYHLGEHKDDRRKDVNGYEDVSLPIDDNTIH